jgi:hypothetical protein
MSSFLDMVNKLGLATAEGRLKWHGSKVLFRADGLDVLVELTFPNYGPPHGMHVSKGLWIPRYPDKPRDAWYGDLHRDLLPSRAEREDLELDTSGRGRGVYFKKEGGGSEIRTIYPIKGSCFQSFSGLSQVQLGALSRLDQVIRHLANDYQVVEHSVAWTEIEQPDLVARFA